MKRICLIGVLAALVAASAASPQAPEPPAPGPQTGTTREASSGALLPNTSCLQCHGDPEWLGEDSVALVELYRADVHAEAGLSCHDCHGGNPDLDTAEDFELAMDEGFEENPYLGAVERGDVPGFCGRCHSDPEYMRRFRPDARVDQEREYWTSQHGRALAVGNQAVATCTDCHGSHGMRSASDPEAPVYPTRVAETCRSCHSDRERMAGATLADGSPLPVDQYARWRLSVHASALLQKGDFSSPTCNDCHGNHGAAPPGVESIVNVCGGCHGREARLFRASAKHAGFEEHAEYMADAGEEGCAACHEDPEPQAALTGIEAFTECATCHGNHAVVRPTVAMLGALPETPCAFCHEGSGPLAEAVREPGQERYLQLRDALLASARSQDLEGTAVFDHLVDQALVLPVHSLAVSSEATPAVPLRPEFKELFEKFRIGKTTFTYEDPEGGGTLRDEVVRCTHCHGPEVVLGDEPAGHANAVATLAKMRELTALTAQAERILLTARRGGVETRDALTAIEGAIDAQIGLEVLVHAFDASEGSAFAERQAEGLDSAREALAAGQAALDELGFRRRGLAIFLVLVSLVAFGLALKIRELSARE